MIKRNVIPKIKVSSANIFRLVFVIFSLYLMGDVFFRWDGFRFYATFSEFLPSVAFIAVLWTVLAGIFSLLVWLVLKMLERITFKVNRDKLLFFTCVFLLVGSIGWRLKWLMWGGMEITMLTKLIAVSVVLLVAVFITWLVRNKAEQWMNIIHEHITPLVWLFGAIVIFSVPFLSYHILIKRPDVKTEERISQTTHTQYDKHPPNIILVTFDALTARDMSVYGYSLPTTPFISEWAKSAAVFTNVKSASNYTSPTVTSLMTGKRVWTHRLYHPSGINAFKIDSENLPLLLKNNGYYTMAFVANPFASSRKLGIYKGFDIAPLVSGFNLGFSLRSKVEKTLVRLTNNNILLSDWIIKRDFLFGKYFLGILEYLSDFSVTEVPPEKPFNKFLETVDKNTREPLFAWIHIYPPHDPYLPPEPYMGMFDDSPALRTYSSQRKILDKVHFSQDMQPTVDTLRKRYDEFIRYCDDQFKNFIAKLETKDVLKNSVVILSADHGESFEHNYLTHGGSNLYEQLTHVPLIIKDYGQNGGKVINELVGQIDIPTTIVDLADIQVPSWMEGRSLVPIMQGGKLMSRPLFAMNFERNPSRGHIITKGTIAVWEGDYKLIDYLNEKRSELFNLKQDPDELNNLMENDQEIGQHLISDIQDMLEKANVKIKATE